MTYSNKATLFPVEEAIFRLLPKDIKILDLGCGAGRTTNALYNMGFTDIVWVDFAENLIHIAKKSFPHLAERFCVGDATNLQDFTDSSYDVVLFSYNGIDYIPTREMRHSAYSEIFRVLKDSALFIFSSHNRRCLPINRNLLFTLMRNLMSIWSEYWKTQQSFWNLETYYSSEKQLSQDLWNIWFQKLAIFPNNLFLYPFLDTFPYYVFQK